MPLLLIASSVVGQTTAEIAGRVRDPAGEPLAGVTVEATSPNLQGTRTATTGRDGAYRLPAVPPGTYRVRTSVSGLHSGERTVVVSLDANATLDFTLRLQTDKDVLVSGQTPPIDETSTTTGTNYSAIVISRLPVARNYADIVNSNPGVATDRGVTEGRSLALSIYGATSAENQWVVDGVNTTNVARGVQGKAINNEFVQEVEVKTGGYQAEYGRALGGTINVITKSGGNAFHGDGFVYYDSTGTAAEKQFKPGDSGTASMRVASGERYDYGFDLGGYFLKDRLWFFGAYNRVTLNGDLSRLQSSEHVPADARFPFQSAGNLYSGKLTWNALPATTIVGTVFADPSTTSGAAGADPRQGLGIGDVEPPVSLEPSTWYSSRTQGGTDYGIRLTQLFGSNAIATLQGSYHRDRNALTAPDGIRYFDERCADGKPDDPCPPPPEPKSITGGYGFVDGQSDHSEGSRQQYAAAVTLYAGNHEIKGGGDYLDGRTDAESFATGQQLVYRQNEYGQEYFAHRFFAVSPTDPTVVPSRLERARVLDYGVFVQDSWRLTQGLTINLGLRWDGEQTQDANGRTVLQFNDQWQPRIGVTWDPWGDGATKVFAFAGRFSYALPTVAASLVYSETTILESYNFDRVSTVQDPSVIGHDEILPVYSGSLDDPVDGGVKASSQDELILGIERVLSPALTVGLKGTYRSLNRTLEDRCDFNAIETGFQCALINPGSDGQYARGDAPTCNGLDWPYQECYPRGPATPEARRIYRGIELLARYSLGSSLWLQASYTYSSLRGNYDGGVNQGSEGLTWPGINPDFDYPAMWHNSYGILFLDRPNRLRLDGYYSTPWRLSVGLQAFAATGAPLNKMGFFFYGYADGANIYLVPRGSAGRLPTLWGTNLSLAYPITLGPTIVTLQAYLFNVFNKQIAISRDDSWSTSPPPGFPATIFDPNQKQTNEEYGAVTGRQTPRVFRAALKVSF